jgi:PAS domain S-box-containing protein
MDTVTESVVTSDTETLNRDAALSDLERAVEQLRVAEEELRVQNEELRGHREAAESALQRYQELFDLAPDPYLTTNAEGVITEANNAAVRLLNVPLETLKGKPISTFVTPGRRRAFRVGLNRIAIGEDPAPGAEEWTVEIRPRRNAPVEVSVTAAGVRQNSGRVSTVRWLLRDVTARRRAESEVRTLFRKERLLSKPLTGRRRNSCR